MPPLRRELLQELLLAYGPGGQEDAVRDVVRRELEPLVDEISVDAAGNLVGLVRGDGGPPVRVMAHLDELAMIVKRVEVDGTLRVDAVGTMYPGNFGLGPVAVLGDEETLTGVLTLGSEHTTQETAQVAQTKPDGGDRAMQWTDVHVFTGRSAEDLAGCGVHAGTLVCVHESRRRLVDWARTWPATSSTTGPRSPRWCTWPPSCGKQDRPGTSTWSPPPARRWAASAPRTPAGPCPATSPSRSTSARPRRSTRWTSTTARWWPTPTTRSSTTRRSPTGCSPSAGRSASLRCPRCGRRSTRTRRSRRRTARAARAALVSLPTLSTHGYEVMNAETIERTARLVTEFLRRPGW
jgi:hypothetical protein